MAVITGHKKWDKDLYMWKTPNEEEMMISGAFSHYEPIINNPKGKIDYIIYTYGNRVEDVSKNPSTVKESKIHCDRILNYLKDKEGNYKLLMYYMDKDAPIVEDAKKVASFIDLLNADGNTNSVTLLSLSKASDMAIYVPKFIKKEDSLNKLNVINVAAPYEGTIMASPRIFYPMIKKLFWNNEIIYKIFKNVYESISSNSHMDYDIAIKDGICLQSYNTLSNEFYKEFDFNKILNNKELLKLIREMTNSPYKYYDSSFIRDIFSKENMDALSSAKSFTNITTGIDKDTLGNQIKAFNLVGIALCLLNKLFLEGKGDGLVKTSSEKLIEDYLDIESIHIPSMHHDIASTKEFDKVLKITHDVITRR